MIKLDSVIHFQDEKKVKTPILNVTCGKCGDRWSQDPKGKEFLECSKCKETTSLKQLFDHLFHRIRTYAIKEEQK